MVIPPINIKNLGKIFGNKSVQNTVGVPLYAPAVVANARHIGLNVYCSSNTPGDGNCWYHAVIEQLRDRNDIGNVSRLRELYPSHYDLRVAVVEFVRFHSFLQNVPYLQNYKFLYEQNIIQVPETEGLNWENFLNQQLQNAVYVTELFIQATAVLLEIDILITSESCTPAQPFNKISKTWDHHQADQQVEENNSNPFLLIGCINSNHFQSLIPFSDMSLFISYANQGRELEIDDSFSKFSKYRKVQSDATKSPEHVLVDFEIDCNKEGKCPNFFFNSSSSNIEENLKYKCKYFNTDYIDPPENETLTECRRRRKQLNIKVKKIVHSNLLEEKLKKECKQYNIHYIAPSENEDKKECKNRRLRLRRQIKIKGKQSTKLNVNENSVSNLNTHFVEPIQIIEESREPNVISENSFIHSNPRVVEAIQNFEQSESKHDVGKCNICYEIQPIFYEAQHVEPKLNKNDIFTKSWSINEKGICDRCYKETLQNKKKKHPVVHKFSGIFTETNENSQEINHNNMHFHNIPPYLKDLTNLETAMISKINIIMNVTVLKYGMLSGKGHSIGIPNDMKIAKSLPTLPKDVGIILLRKKGKSHEAIRDYTVKRDKVEQALKGLVYGFPHGGVDKPMKNYKLYDGPDHLNVPLKGKYFEWFPNPYYFDVLIDLERISQLPINENEVCPGLPCIEFESEMPDLKKNIAEGQPGSSDLCSTYSGIVTPLQPNDVNRKLNQILQKIIGDEEAVENVIRHGNIGVAQLNSDTYDPIQELKTCGFFAQAYPTIFINGSGDITIPQIKNVDYQEWVTHIYHCCDNRVSSHPFLKFFLLNLGLRMRALKQGSFIVAQQLNDAHLSIDELRENLENNDESVPRKLISVGAKFPNSDPYWKDRKIELDNFVLFRRKEYGDLPAYFDTNSLAEFHWKCLKELLLKYESKIQGISIEVLRQKTEENFMYYRKMVLSNLHIVTRYFDKRCINYYKTVGKELFQTSDMWIRYEFAKGRGEIHSHAIISSKKHAQKIREAMDLVSFDKQTGQMDTKNAAKKLHSWLQTDSENTETLFSPNFISMHPAGGHETVDEAGCRIWCPNKNLWPKPEGNYESSINPLSEKFSDHDSNPQTLEAFHISLTNKIGIHKCNSTCLKYKHANSKAKYCRFHFGKTDHETKTSDGKKIHPFHSIITDGENPRFEGNRDHPFLISHIKTRILTWLANSDTQPIIDQKLRSLLKYITQYACKGAITTDDYVNLYRHLLDKNSDSNSIRSIAQKLLLKIIGFIDMPAAAVDYMNCGGHLFHCTRKFRRISLSGYRMLSLNSKEGTATKETPLDQFLSNKRREDHPRISLYDWAKICNCSKDCGEKHVPVFTGLPTLPVWPLSEDFCKAQLMIYSPGTWNSVDDLKFGESYTYAFSQFINTEFCPTIVKDLVEESKREFDKKVLKDKKRPNLETIPEENENDMCNTDFSSDSDSEFGDFQEMREEISLQNMILNNVSDAQCERLQQIHCFKSLPDGGEGFNWHSYAKDCFGGYWPENAKNWLESISAFAEEQESLHNSNCDLPSIDLMKANSLQRVIISINILNFMRVANNAEKEHIRLLVQGTAGSGKSFTIVALTYLARRLLRRNSAVLNLAPTGAASILIPDGRTVHSTTNIPRIKCSKTMQLNDKPLTTKSLLKLRKITGSLLEGDELKLMILNLDERGMFSPNLLAWCNHRFKEASGDLINSFGAIPNVNFFGDLGQLGPIDSKDLHVEPLSSESPVKLAGYAIYRSFTDCILLNETMRQGPDQIEFLNLLFHIRNGEINQNDWKTINSRYEGELPKHEKKNFESDTCLTVMETWAEVHLGNHEKLESLQVPVATIPSIGKGRHHSQIDKQVGQIPSTSFIAVGSRVLLTKNQYNLTPFGLNNGAIGNVVAILYEKNSGPPAFPEAVVVNFPRYKGPSWIPQHPTWIPISVNESRCERNCCHRRGLPLMPGYCIPISKSQGMTVGPNEPNTHLRIKLNKENFMEKLNLGITFTAFSRACKLENIALVEKLPFERLSYINNHPWMARRREEEKRLQKMCEMTLEKYGQYRDYEVYKKLLIEFDDFVNDGLSCL